MDASQDTREEKLSISEKLNQFMQKHRMKLIIGFISLFVILIGFIAGFSISDKAKVKAFIKIDEFERRYEDLRSFISSEEPDAVSKQADINALLEDLTAFQKKNSGFAAARAYGISAGIYENQKKWAEAEKAWSDAANAAKKSYLAPVALYNAAVAAEEQGNAESAVGFYKKALDFDNSFIGAARAQFSIGRLEESRNNREAALESYRILVNKWPNDPIWSNLAHSRIIILSD